MSGEDVYDVGVPMWCELCKAPHLSCTAWEADLRFTCLTCFKPIEHGDEVDEDDPGYAAWAATPRHAKCDQPVPRAITKGWNEIVLVSAPQPRTQTRHALVFYPDGRIAFRHECDHGERGLIICAPFLRIGDGHTLVSRYPLTVIPSILCPDCGTHGFVTDGNWVSSESPKAGT